jgi:hypothetical protein
LVALLALLLLLAVLASLAFLGRRRRVAELEAELGVARAELARLRVAHAGLDARREAAVVEAERLRLVEADLKRALSTTEQEKTRLDFELRQVALVASRVALLEPQVEQLAVARRELSEANERIAGLLPLADELALRNQFIETLQRELSYRDERAVGLEQRVAQLVRRLAALERPEPADTAAPAPSAVAATAPTADPPEPAVGAEPAQIGIDPDEPAAATPADEVVIHLVERAPARSPVGVAGADRAEPPVVDVRTPTPSEPG